MTKITCLIIDDERLARQELRLLLKSHPNFMVVDEAANADEGLQKIQHHQPDLIFLDIQMPEKTGFDLLESLGHAPKVIFTTAFDQYAIQAFEVNALDYLLKPIREERIEQTLRKVKLSIEKERQKIQTPELDQNRQIFIKNGDQCFFLQLDEVFLIQSVGNYARLFFGEQKAMIKRSLNALEEKLPSTHFFRANRQELINVKFIGKIEPMFKGTLRIYLQNGAKVDVSERRSVKFKEMMSL